MTTLSINWMQTTHTDAWLKCAMLAGSTSASYSCWYFCYIHLCHCIVIWLVLFLYFLCCTYADTHNGGTIGGIDCGARLQTVQDCFSPICVKAAAVPQSYTMCRLKSMRGRCFRAAWTTFEKNKKASSVAKWTTVWHEVLIQKRSTVGPLQWIKGHLCTLVPLCGNICDALERRTPPFLPSAIPGCGAEVRVFLAQSEIVASDQERNHQILSGFDKNETSPLCPSGESFPGNLRVIRESKHTGARPSVHMVNNPWPPGWGDIQLRAFKSSSGKKEISQIWPLSCSDLNFTSWHLAVKIKHPSNKFNVTWSIKKMKCFVLLLSSDHLANNLLQHTCT